MQNGLYVSLSAQASLERRLETVANNVANMNTVGFRSDGVRFAAEVARAGDSLISYVSPGVPYISRAAGGSVKTDNPFDVAIQGDGWMSISTQSGVVYTRDGRMRMAESGALETLIGNPVLDAGGSPIVLNPADGAPTIGGDGMISQNGREVGAIGLYEIDPGANLTRAENSGVVPDKPATPTLDFAKNGFIQGYVEGSNVNPIEQMTKLISLTRNFDSVNSGVTRTESSLEDAIKTLGS